MQFAGALRWQGCRSSRSTAAMVDNRFGKRHIQIDMDPVQIKCAEGRSRWWGYTCVCPVHGDLSVHLLPFPSFELCSDEGLFANWMIFTILLSSVKSQEISAWFLAWRRRLSHFPHFDDVIETWVFQPEFLSLKFFREISMLKYFVLFFINCEPFLCLYFSNFANRLDDFCIKISTVVSV